MRLKPLSLLLAGAALWFVLGSMPASVACAQSNDSSATRSKSGSSKIKVERFDRATVRFDALFGVGWYNDVGPGFRLEVPLIRNLAKGIPNELYASAGVELRWFYHRDYEGFGVYPVAVGQWDFHLSDRWTVFPEAGFAGVFAPYRKRFWGAPIAPYAGGGVRYYFGERMAFVMRMSWPIGFQIGMTF
jgi:hypothetical protein